MKIRFLKSMACEINGSFGPGNIADWKDSKEAEHLIELGIAEKASTRKKTEKATANTADETATTD